MRFILVQFLSLCLATEVLAHTPKEGDIWIGIGPTLDALVGHSYGPNSGWGILIEADIDEKGGLELGLYSFEKRYWSEPSGYAALEQNRRMQVSMGYRRWFKPQVGLGLAFATGYSMGDLQTLESSGTLPANYKSFANRTAEYSLRTSLEYEYAGIGRTFLSITGYYDYSLHDKSDVKAGMAGLFLTFKYLLKEK